MRLRIATRGSELARWQANHVAALLRAAIPEAVTELAVVETSGDRDLHLPIWEIGGKGVFVKEVQAAVLEGGADVAVHSAKDLPAATPDGLVVGAYPERGDPRDALVGCSLSELPTGARVATGSVRRRAQLANLRPDLTFEELRGNIATRLEKALAFDAAVVAVAALARLARLDRVREILEPARMVPQVGQGALAVECRAGDEVTRELLALIDHPPSRQAVEAERAYLRELGGDCNLPAGAHAVVTDGGELRMEAMLASLDGHVVLRERRTGTDPERLGRELAGFLLRDAGGEALLAV